MYIEHNHEFIIMWQHNFVSYHVPNIWHYKYLLMVRPMDLFTCSIFHLLQTSSSDESRSVNSTPLRPGHNNLIILKVPFYL